MMLNDQKKLQSIQSGGATLLPMILLLSMFLSGCTSWVYEDLPECVAGQRLQFRYTKNVLNADAFSAQVNSIQLYIYDDQNELISVVEERRELNEVNDYYVDLKLPVGRYSFIAWCEGKPQVEDAVAFTLPGQRPGANIDDGRATLPLFGAAGAQYSDRDIVPLYFGRMDNITVAASNELVELPIMYLTKDTNLLTVQVQNMDGSPVDPSLLEFRLEGSNSVIDQLNIPTATPAFEYRPWDTVPTYTLMDEESDGPGPREAAAQSPSGVMGVFSLSRLMADREQYLTITRRDTRQSILRVPLIEYLLMVRGYYQSDSPQDFLDRNDKYTMVYFIQNDYSWMRARILINGWRVVPPQSGTLGDGE